MKDNDKERELHMKQSGRMRALNRLARIYPQEFQELYEREKEEVGRRWDEMDTFFER